MDGCVVKKGLDGFIVVFGPWSGDILVIIRYSKCARLSNHVEKESTRGELTRGPTPTDGRCSIANVRSPANHRVSYGNFLGGGKKKRGATCKRLTL